MDSIKIQKNIKKEDLVDFAKEFLVFLHTFKKNNTDRAVVVGLSGDLGAGKTTFSQAIARELGIEEVVNSPTFAIQKTYITADSDFPRFIHIDAYRIEEEKEMEVLKFIELLVDSGNLLFIEWPSKIANLLPASTIFLEFETIDQNTRKISYQVSS